MDDGPAIGRVVPGLSDALGAGPLGDGTVLGLAGVRGGGGQRQRRVRARGPAAAGAAVGREGRVRRRAAAAAGRCVARPDAAVGPRRGFGRAGGVGARTPGARRPAVGVGRRRAAGVPVEARLRRRPEARLGGRAVRPWRRALPPVVVAGSWTHRAWCGAYGAWDLAAVAAGPWAAWWCSVALRWVEHVLLLIRVLARGFLHGSSSVCGWWCAESTAWTVVRWRRCASEMTSVRKRR